MIKLRQILILFLSLILSISIVEAGGKTISSSSDEFLTENCFEEEEEESIHSLEYSDQNNIGISGGNASSFGVFEPVLEYSFPSLRQTKTIHPCGLKRSSALDYYILYCSLKIDC